MILILIILSLAIVLGLNYSRFVLMFPENNLGVIPQFFLSQTGEPSFIDIETPTLVSDHDKSYYVSLSGSDTNPGTESQPWETIQKAADTLLEGESAYILEGEYDERVNITNSGIILEAVGNVIMRGFSVSGNSNSIIGFEITDPSNDAGLQIEGNYNLLTENEIYHMKQDGIWFFGDGNIFRGNYIHDILEPSIPGDPHVDCFQSWGPATNIVFEGNLCLHTRTSGSNQILMLESQNSPVYNLTFSNNIFVMDDPGYSPMNFHRKEGQNSITNIKIINNNFIHRKGIGQYAIRLVLIDNVTIQNNLFIDYGTEYDPYIKLEGSNTNITIGYNAVYKTDGVAPFGGPYEKDLWMINPKLEDFQNLKFSILRGSPLIDTGMTIESISVDFEMNRRPLGNGFDIGAIEYPGN